MTPLEHILNQLGVLPAPKINPPQPQPIGWTPKHPGDEPPF